MDAAVDNPVVREPRMVHLAVTLAVAPDNHLTIVQETDGHFGIWLDTPVASCDGLCIGTGPTPRDAQLDALKTLDYAKQALLSVNAAEIVARTPAGTVEA